MASIICRVDALRTLPFGSITSSYLALGTSFGHIMRIIRITNNTDGDMLFSFDGSTNNIFVPAGGFVLYDATSNREEGGEYFIFEVGTQIFVKYSTAPTSGDVWLECLYGKGE